MVLLAEAMDAEELEDRNMATLVAIGVNDPKRLKNWKFNSPDKAGTQPLNMNPAQSLANFVGVQALKGKVSAAQSKGSAIAFAKATGRPIAYMDQAGNLFDEDGQPTIRTTTTIIVPLEQETVH